MSLFGGLMGDLDDDPYFGGHMRRMNNMMNSMMNDIFAPPFGGMFGGGNQGRTDMVPYDHRQHHRRPPAHQEDFMNPMGNALMPMGFGFPMLRGLFGNMGNTENCHSYSSSTFMTMTSGPDGRPQVYQASTSTRQAPGGVKETKKSVADSRTGLKKMSIGHHIGERAHIMAREQNLYEGTAEEHQEFINLEEEEADHFNREWERKAHGGNSAIGYHGGQSRHQHRGRNQQLALPPASSSSSRSSSSGGDGGGSGKKRKQEDEEDSGDEHERDLRDERPQPKRRSHHDQPIVLEVSDSDE